MKVGFSKSGVPARGALAVIAFSGGKLSKAAEAADAKSGGAIRRAIRASPRFKGEKGQFVEVLGPAGLRVTRIVVAGVGKSADVDGPALENLGGTLAKRVTATGDTILSIAADPMAGSPLSGPELAAHIAYGAKLGTFRFDRYRTTEKEEKKPSLTNLNVLTANPAAARRAFAPLLGIAESVVFARNLVTEPGNVIYPRSLADQAKTLAVLGVKVEVLPAARLAKLGMGALLGVAQGSAHEPYVVVMQWSGMAGSKKGPIAFVGKGVTFDSGGLSLKPAASMEEMKFDMAGSAAVIGVMRALAARKAKVNAVGVVGLVENMPSSKAQRPGDVVRSMSGQTIEVLNTDAEGRLVLADCLWYTKERFKPRAMINLATLTGAIIVALGHFQAGMFSNDDDLAAKLTAAGNSENERLWRMPMGDDYDREIDSEIADMKNIGGKGAGSITAAQFLKRFVGNTPWAHLDIAGTAWTYKDQAVVPKGATGFGVRLLNRLVADNFENK